MPRVRVPGGGAAEELREVVGPVLDWIREISGGIADEIERWLIDLPQGSYHLMYRLGDVYTRAGRVLGESLENHASSLTQPISESWSGSAALRYAQSWPDLQTQATKAVAALASLADMATSAGVEIETMVFAAASNIGLLAENIFSAACTLWMSGGLSLLDVLAAMAGCRAGIRSATRELLEALLSKKFAGELGDFARFLGDRTLAHAGGDAASHAPADVLAHAGGDAAADVLADAGGDVAGLAGKGLATRYLKSIGDRLVARTAADRAAEGIAKGGLRDMATRLVAERSLGSALSGRAASRVAAQIVKRAAYREALEALGKQRIGEVWKTVGKDLLAKALPSAVRGALGFVGFQDGTTLVIGVIEELQGHHPDLTVSSLFDQTVSVAFMGGVGGVLSNVVGHGMAGQMSSMMAGTAAVNTVKGALGQPVDWVDSLGAAGSLGALGGARHGPGVLRGRIVRQGESLLGGRVADALRDRREPAPPPEPTGIEALEPPAPGLGPVLEAARDASPAEVMSTAADTRLRPSGSDDGAPGERVPGAGPVGATRGGASTQDEAPSGSGRSTVDNKRTGPHPDDASPARDASTGHDRSPERDRFPEREGAPAEVDSDPEPTHTASTDTASTDTASTDTASTDTASADTGARAGEPGSTGDGPGTTGDVHSSAGGPVSLRSVIYQSTHVPNRADEPTHVGTLAGVAADHAPPSEHRSGAAAGTRAEAAAYGPDDSRTGDPADSVTGGTAADLGAEGAARGAAAPGGEDRNGGPAGAGHGAGSRGQGGSGGDGGPGDGLAAPDDDPGQPRHGQDLPKRARALVAGQRRALDGDRELGPESKLRLSTQLDRIESRIGDLEVTIDRALSSGGLDHVVDAIRGLKKEVDEYFKIRYGGHREVGPHGSEPVERALDGVDWLEPPGRGEDGADPGRDGPEDSRPRAAAIEHSPVSSPLLDILKGGDPPRHHVARQWGGRGERSLGELAGTGHHEADAAYAEQRGQAVEEIATELGLSDPEALYALTIAYDVASDNYAPFIVRSALKMLPDLRADAEAGRLIVWLGRDAEYLRIATEAFDPELVGNSHVALISRKIALAAVQDLKNTGMSFPELGTFIRPNPDDVPCAAERLTKHLELNGIPVNESGTSVTLVDNGLRGTIQEILTAIYPNTNFTGRYIFFIHSPHDPHPESKTGYHFHLGLDRGDDAILTPRLPEQKELAFRNLHALNTLENSMEGPLSSPSRFDDDGNPIQLPARELEARILRWVNPILVPGVLKDTLVREGVLRINLRAVADCARRTAGLRLHDGDWQGELGRGAERLYSNLRTWLEGGAPDPQFELLATPFSFKYDEAQVIKIATIIKRWEVSDEEARSIWTAYDELPTLDDKKFFALVLKGRYRSRWRLRHGHA